MTVAIARIALGFLIAPLSGSFMLTLTHCIAGADGPALFAACTGQMFPFLAWLGLFCAYPTTLLLGVPLFLALQRRNQLRPVQLAFAGLVLGVLATALFLAIDQKPSLESVAWAVPVALRAGVGWAGPIAGLVFWLVAVFRNDALVHA